MCGLRRRDGVRVGLVLEDHLLRARTICDRERRRPPRRCRPPRPWYAFRAGPATRRRPARSSRRRAGSSPPAGPACPRWRRCPRCCRRGSGGRRRRCRCRPRPRPRTPALPSARRTRPRRGPGRRGTAGRRGRRRSIRSNGIGPLAVWPPADSAKAFTSSPGHPETTAERRRSPATGSPGCTPSGSASGVDCRRIVRRDGLRAADRGVADDPGAPSPGAGRRASSGRRWCRPRRRGRRGSWGRRRRTGSTPAAAPGRRARGDERHAVEEAELCVGVDHRRQRPVLDRGGRPLPDQRCTSSRSWSVRSWAAAEGRPAPGPAPPAPPEGRPVRRASATRRPGPPRASRGTPR